MVQAIFLLLCKPNSRRWASGHRIWCHGTAVPAFGSLPLREVQWDAVRKEQVETTPQVMQMAALVICLHFRSFSFLFSFYSRVRKPVGAQESICLSGPESNLQQLLSHSKLKGPHGLQLPEFTQHSCGQPRVSQHQPVSALQDSLRELSLLDPGGQPPNKSGQSWLPAGLLTEGNQT